MQEHFDVFIRGSKYEESFRIMAEKEKLSNELRMLRRIAWDLRAKICQFENALEDISDLRAEMKSLQDQINATADNLGLQQVTDDWE